jgi:general secretion pathway protein A
MIDQAGRDRAPSPAGTAYEEFFGLTEAPFADSPDPRFLFQSQAHRGALEQIEQSILRGERLIAFTGEAGTGKSTLCRVLANRSGARRFVAAVGHAPATADDLLRHVLDGFDQLSTNPRDVVRTNRYALERTLARFLEGLVRCRRGR